MAKGKPKAGEIILHPQFARNKFELWCYYYLNPENTETYLNATKSALESYDTQAYHSAGQIGHENLKKLENRAKIISDQGGLTLPALIKIGAMKVMQGSFEDWLKFMDYLGYKGDDAATAPTQQQAQAQTVNVQITNLMKDIQE